MLDCKPDPRSDPAGFEDGPNLYAYVHNRPLTYFDAYGLFATTLEFNTQSGMSNTLWNGAGGMLHGAFEFGANQFYALNSLCCMIGAHEMDFSFDERNDAIGAFSQSQADLASNIDIGIQRFLRVDPNSAAYQNSRYYTDIGMEVGSCIAGGYGLAKGAAKGLTSLAARRSAILTQRAASNVIASAGQIAGSEIMLGGQVARRGIASGAENVNAGVNLNRKLSRLEYFQKAAVRTKTLPDGRIRYYDVETISQTAGPTSGACNVLEWNAKTNKVRGWYECHDIFGNVNRVHPKNINGQLVLSPHYPPTGRELI